MFDFGTGGLDLAYEVMRGYDALVLIDVSRQGGEPGTLYVMEAAEDDVEAGIEDGQVLNPHGMDPQTVLRFVKTLGAWPGKVVIVACEPAVVEEMGIGADRRGPRRRRTARWTSCSRRSRSCATTRRTQPRGLTMHELSLSGAIVNTVVKHADGRRVSRRDDADRRAAPGRARHAGVLLRVRLAGDRLRGGAAGAGARPRPARCAGCEREWEIDFPDFRCPACGRAGVEVVSGNEFEVESIEVEEVACIA